LAESRLIGIFGGTFDPIHNGHLQSVLSLFNTLHFDRIHLLPSSTPPHRSPTHSSSQHRLRMVELVSEDFPQLIADDRECMRQGKSYTIDTLKSFRAQFPDDSLAFITGMDAYLDMPNWKQWQDYLTYAHIIVMQRPGYKLIPSWGEKYIIDCESRLFLQMQGSIYFAQTELVDISSTQIREKIKSGKSLQDDLPDNILNYIIENKLYANT